MIKIVCELCGSNELVKDGEYFVCQYCGTKYTVEQARKLIVEGTVKIDRSDETEKTLKNADNTYLDGNYKEAFSLYSTVLNDNPDNAHAILYRAVCSAWQSTTDKCNLVELNNAISRSIELKHSQCGDIKEYFSFANDLIVQCDRVVKAINNMYINYYNKNQAVGYGLVGLVAASEQNSNTKQFMQNGVVNCCTTLCNIVDNIFNPVKYYGESFELLFKNAIIIIKAAKTYRSNASLSQDKKLDNYITRIEELKKDALLSIEKRKAEKKESYWIEHSEERIALENKMNQLRKQKHINEQYVNSIPGVIEIREINKEIRQFQDEIDSLGVFKIKEKTELKEKISKLTDRIESIKASIEPILSVKRSEMEAIQKQIDEIKLEFNKDR